MGYDLERFACEIDPSLKCPICLKVFENPVQVDCVGGSKNVQHIFCRSCLIETFASSDRLKCPIDGKLFKRNTRRSLFLIPPQELFDKLSSLPIRCSFAGCLMSVRLAELDSHIEICQYNPNRQLSELMDSNGVNFLPQTKTSNQNQSWFMDIDSWNSPADVATNNPLPISSNVNHPNNLSHQPTIKSEPDLEKIMDSLLNRIEMKFDERFERLSRIVSHESDEGSRKIQTTLHQEIEVLKKWKESTVSRFEDQVKKRFEILHKKFLSRETERSPKRQRNRSNREQNEKEEISLKEEMKELKCQLEKVFNDYKEDSKASTDEALAKISTDLRKLQQDFCKERKDSKKSLEREFGLLKKEVKRSNDLKLSDQKTFENFERRLNQISCTMTNQLKEFKATSKNHDVGIKNILNRLKNISTQIESELKSEPIEQPGKPLITDCQSEITQGNTENSKRRKSLRLNREASKTGPEVVMESLEAKRKDREAKTLDTQVASSSWTKKESPIEVLQESQQTENCDGEKVASQETIEKKSDQILIATEKVHLQEASTDLSKSSPKCDPIIEEEVKIEKTPENSVATEKQATVTDVLPIPGTTRSSCSLVSTSSFSPNSSFQFTQNGSLITQNICVPVSTSSLQTPLSTPCQSFSNLVLSSPEKVDKKNDTDLLAKIVNEVLFKDIISSVNTAWPSHGRTQTTFVRPLIDPRTSTLLRPESSRRGSDTILVAITRPLASPSVRLNCPTTEALVHPVITTNQVSQIKTVPTTSSMSVHHITSLPQSLTPETLTTPQTQPQPANSTTVISEKTEKTCTQQSDEQDSLKLEDEVSMTKSLVDESSRKNLLEKTEPSLEKQQVENELENKVEQVQESDEKRENIEKEESKSSVENLGKEKNGDEFETKSETQFSADTKDSDSISTRKDSPVKIKKSRGRRKKKRTTKKLAPKVTILTKKVTFAEPPERIEYETCDADSKNFAMETDENSQGKRAISCEDPPLVSVSKMLKTAKSGCTGKAIKKVKPLIIRTNKNSCLAVPNVSLEHKTYTCSGNKNEATKPTGMITRLRESRKMLSKKTCMASAIVMKTRRFNRSVAAQSSSTLALEKKFNSITSIDVGPTRRKSARQLSLKKADLKVKADNQTHSELAQKPKPTLKRQLSVRSPKSKRRRKDEGFDHGKKSSPLVNNTLQLLAGDDGNAPKVSTLSNKESPISTESMSKESSTQLISSSNKSQEFEISSNDYEFRENSVIDGDELAEFEAIQKHLNSIIDMIDAELKEENQLAKASVQ